MCIEGLNFITPDNCDLTAGNTPCNGNATFLDAIMICQSMSGDAANVIANGCTLYVNGAALTGTN